MQRERRRFLSILVAGVAGGSSLSSLQSAIAAAGDAFELLKFVVPTQAGTVNDSLARLVAKTLDEKFGQRTVVENMLGAGGVIAAEYVRRSGTEGRTLALLMGNDGIMAIAPAIGPAMGQKLPFAPQTDFVPISLLAEADFLLVTNRSRGPHTLEELIGEAKRRPGQINYASAGIGTAHHLGMELLKRQLGLELVHVAYKGAPAGLTDLVGGRVDVMLTGIAPALVHIKSGRLSVLGISGSQRSPLLPEVQPLGEKVSGFRLTSWFGVFAAAGAAPGATEELGRNLSSVMRSSEVATVLQSQGIMPVGAGANELRARLASDSAKFSSLAIELKDSLSRQK
jgi:tripartite-type tricarboxylate transporter receptor subunit TctC